MTREQANLVRLLIMCAVWAAAEVVLLRLGLFDPLTRIVVPAALAAAVYVLTDDLGRGGRSDGGAPRYWRGRRIDDDDKRRWN